MGSLIVNLDFTAAAACIASDFTGSAASTTLAARPTVTITTARGALHFARTVALAAVSCVNHSRHYVFLLSLVIIFGFIAIIVEIADINFQFNRHILHLLLFM